MSKTKISEWMWRFLAIAMMFSVVWSVWIIYQLNPPALITNAAFEAAAKARVKGTQSEKQSVQGVIVPSGSTAAASSASEATAVASTATEAPAVAVAPKEPPINPEKLKFSDSISLPVPNAKK